MRYVKWFVIIAFWVLVAGFLHYTLPQHDVARITDTYEKRIDPGENALFWANASTGENVNLTGRDVFFIQTRLNNDKVMVYRNEDTGWGWPPYFKFDTSNLQAEAADLRSTAAAPQWVVIKHYGWRNEFLSVYPNVVSIRPVDGPDVRIIPWLNIVLLTLIVAVSWAIWVRWRRFREARIDPVLEDVGDNLDEAGGRIRGLFRRKG
ncbi:DUF1523 family protein [Salipiger thiooxidans]|uniref:DUF1523 family protein n=1 Tax=Salipiger thiooxidans TaxID=282683 RepID=UPI001CD4EF6C|nr:DUF1523 family protein [Salipiger thiooxidans]MCA0846212.1 DUF1523 family protein [Salipiger thiooxidans]